MGAIDKLKIIGSESAIGFLQAFGMVVMELCQQAYQLLLLFGQEAV